MSYLRRIVDDELDELLPALPAVALEGARGVGKTETALQRAVTVYRLDDPAQQAIAEADPEQLLQGDPPVLLDEWQRVPAVWDSVRRAVDSGAPARPYPATERYSAIYSNPSPRFPSASTPRVLKRRWAIFERLAGGRKWT
ncbi:MAG: AAA family ATPase [Rhodothermales bacterium]